jgi:hypothetical protein
MYAICVARFPYPIPSGAGIDRGRGAKVRHSKRGRTAMELCLPPVEPLIKSVEDLVAELEYPEQRFLELWRHPERSETDRPPSPPFIQLHRAQLVARCQFSRDKPGFADAFYPLVDMCSAFSRLLAAIGGDWFNASTRIIDAFDVRVAAAEARWGRDHCVAGGLGLCVTDLRTSMVRGLATVKALGRLDDGVRELYTKTARAMDLVISMARQLYRNTELRIGVERL